MDSNLGSRRPVYLNLLKIRMPVMAVVSIAHRAAGILLFLGIPLLVWMLKQSVSGPEGFAAVSEWLSRTDVRLGLLVLLWALAHHFFAGLRFLVIDLDYWTQRESARASAWAVHACALATVAAIAAGWWA